MQGGSGPLTLNAAAVYYTKSRLFMLAPPMLAPRIACQSVHSFNGKIRDYYHQTSSAIGDEA
jgi:hypothetical protein